MTDFAERLENHSIENPYPGASVHDPDRIMTPAEIIAMKQELVGDPTRLVALAGFIVAGMLVESYEDDAAQRADTTISYASNVPQDLEGRVGQAAHLGAHWGFSLMELCRLPKDEWIEGRTSPGNFAVWLEDMDAKTRSDAALPAS